MKKLVKLLLLLTLVISAIIYWLTRPIIKPQLNPSTLPVSDSNNLLDQLSAIDFESKTYHFAYVIVPDPTKLQLFLNHDAKSLSIDLIKSYHCSILTNGNFYDTNDKPLGWLVSQREILSKPISSSLFNGFFSLSAGQPNLSFEFPNTDVELGIQSGPILILNSAPLSLKLTSDQPRRRVILAINDQSQLIFIVLTGSDSPFSGPLLVDTPALTMAVAKKINQNLEAALNLDGGSASAFYSGPVHLTEYSYIGSFFCYNDSI